MTVQPNNVDSRCLKGAIQSAPHVPCTDDENPLGHS